MIYEQKQQKNDGDKQMIHEQKQLRNDGQFMMSGGQQIMRGMHMLFVGMTIREALMEASSFLVAAKVGKQESGQREAITREVSKATERKAVEQIALEARAVEQIALEANALAREAIERQAIAREAASEAEWLLMHAQGYQNRAELWLHSDQVLIVDVLVLFEELLKHKASGEPLQYLMGEASFYGREFYVDASVLIPRSDTERLVETVLKMTDRLPGLRRGAPVRVAEIGVGSGAVAVTLACERPSWHVQAVDRSAVALQTARRNAKLHGALGRMCFRLGDGLAPLVAARVELDVLVSNPPYLRRDELGDQLQTEVRHEPRLALDGGGDGLRFYRAWINGMTQLPRIPRLIVFEVGIGQASAVVHIMRKAGHWREVAVVKDYNGVDRVVYGWR